MACTHRFFPYAVSLNEIVPFVIYYFPRRSFCLRCFGLCEPQILIRWKDSLLTESLDGWGNEEQNDEIRKKSLLTNEEVYRLAKVDISEY